jgi:hypothetical protein
MDCDLEERSSIDQQIEQTVLPQLNDVALSILQGTTNIPFNTFYRFVRQSIRKLSQKKIEKNSLFRFFVRFLKNFSREIEFIRLGFAYRQP